MRSALGCESGIVLHSVETGDGGGLMPLTLGSVDFRSLNHRGPALTHPRRIHVIQECNLLGFLSKLPLFTSLGWGNGVLEADGLFLGNLGLTKACSIDLITFECFLRLGTLWILLLSTISGVTNQQSGVSSL